MAKQDTKIPKECPYCGAPNVIQSSDEHLSCTDCGKAWPKDFDPKADLAEEE